VRSRVSCPPAQPKRAENRAASCCERGSREHEGGSNLLSSPLHRLIHRRARSRPNFPSRLRSSSSSQPVIIENVGGAGGSIAVGRVARAAPDGYTIDIGQWDTHVGSVIYPLTYDLQKDFEPIGLISINPQLLVGKKALPADDLKTLVA
jgi:Tripartite tricarboxylate transporter family receptor